MSSLDVRSFLVDALRADLVGPFLPSGEETLALAPSATWLTGFITPENDRVPTNTEDPTEDDDSTEAGNDKQSDDGNDADRPAGRPRFLPASIGLSILLAPGTARDHLTVTVRYADYEPFEAPRDAQDQARELDPGHIRKHWKRIARNPKPIRLPLDPTKLTEGVPVPDSRGLVLIGHLREVGTAMHAAGLADGSRALSLFLVNRRTPMAGNERDAAYAFQVEMSVSASCPILPRPNPRDENTGEDDSSVADLQFRHIQELAVGHGVATEHDAQTIRTVWLPTAEVKAVRTRSEPGVMIGMEELASLTTGAAARDALLPIITAYTAWIEAQRKIDVSTGRRDTVQREQTRDSLMDRAATACGRIREGIELLAADVEVLEAFTLANQAMAMAARQRSPERYADGQKPTWRLFQLAFVLMNLPSIASDDHADREVVELIFFPTGGGKTEAYLGVIAFTLILRRMRGRSRPDGGLGVAVLLRYTLRLLTLDQLGRAATLICALEVMRRKAREEDKTLGEKLGEERFAIGLWVGRKATANTMAQVEKQLNEYKISTARNPVSPCPVTLCPWCQQPLTKDSFELKMVKKTPTAVNTGCADWRCAFSRKNGGIPVVFVDEQLYRELPCFIVATVDKFAMLPWRGETGMLFGRVHSRDRGDFYGPMDSSAPLKGHQALPDGLRPPELIVQDELHLISGPLGTMVGLYETAIEALSATRSPGDKVRKPKIIASTATVKRASHHARVLFGRRRTQIFPPAGVNDGENYFAELDPDAPPRLYLGVGASGRSMKRILLVAYAALLSAAKHKNNPKDGPNPNEDADPYMTLAGYFNALRELGGMRRLVEDEVRTRCANAEERKPVDFTGEHPWLSNRLIQFEPVELTSRESTFNISASKDRLAKHHSEADYVDVLLASNMISVGVDIERLGLMVVAGQPKTTSEYIQASSRVGRDKNRPGLVVTCYNLHRPRDRSHYEHFNTYHTAFYRDVEAQSLTPFSGPALDRGLAAILVAITRLSAPEMTAAEAVLHLVKHRHIGDRAAEIIADRAASIVDNTADAAKERTHVHMRATALLDAWTTIMTRATQEEGSKRRYSDFDHGKGEHRALLHLALTNTSDFAPDEKLFPAPTSMRDVEPSVHVWVSRQRLTRPESETT